MRNRFTQFVRDDEGQDLVEYAFLATALALAAFAGAKFLGGALENWYAVSAGAAGAGAAAAATIGF